MLTSDIKCNTAVHTIGEATLETMFPAFGYCDRKDLALLISQIWLDTPCYTQNAKSAETVLFPTFATGWGGSIVKAQENPKVISSSKFADHRDPFVSRNGSVVIMEDIFKQKAETWKFRGGGRRSLRECREQFLPVVPKILQRLQLSNAKQIVIVDTSGTHNNMSSPVRQQYIVELARYVPRNISILWAAMGLVHHDLEMLRVMKLTGRVRPYSLPYPSTSYCHFTPELNQKRNRPLHNRSHFMSFVGRLHKNRVRGHIAQLYHDKIIENRKVVIQSRVNGAEQEVEMFEASIFDSVFTLVLPGDHPHSYRFNEAVCSGGVPVLVESNDPMLQIMPPHDKAFPFSLYGIRAHNISDLAQQLKAVPWHRREELRSNALKVCAIAFSTTAGSFYSMLNFVVNNKDAAHACFPKAQRGAAA
jgi:hypothetical protein